MAGPWERFQTADLDRGQPQGPWSKFHASGPRDFGIDWSEPVETVRAKVAQLPEGDRDEALRQWADAFVAKEREQGGIGQTINNAVRTAARGTMVGSFLDEANAATQSALHGITGGYMGAPYDETLAYERAQDRAFDKANPVSSTVGQVASGIASGGLAYRAGPGIASAIVGGPAAFVRPAETVLGNVVRGAAVGVPTGAVAGYGAGEGDERLDAARRGGIAGGVIGGVLPPVVAFGQYGIGQVADTFAPAIARMRHGPQAAADQIIANTARRSGQTPNSIAADIATNERAATMGSNSVAESPTMLADTSDAMQRLTGSVYRTGGRAGDITRQALQSRQRGPENPYAPRADETPQGQTERILDAYDRAMQIRTSGSARQTEAAMVAQQRAEGRRLYGEAYQNEDAFDIQPAIDGLALTIQQYPPPFAARLTRALRLFVTPTPNRQGIWPVDNIRRFDAAKKSLDDMIDKAQRGGENNLARELTTFKDNLLQHVHAPGANGQPRNPIYQEARDTWGSLAQEREAIDLGRAALREGSEISVEQFRALNPGQQRLFRIGLRESIRNALGTRKPGDDVTQLFQQRRVQELLNEAIPRSRGVREFSDRPERFGQYMANEQRMVQTRNAALGNSATAQRQQDDLQMGADVLGTMWNRFRSAPSLFNMGIEALATGMNRVFGYRQDVALHLARQLTATNPRVRNGALTRMRRTMGQQRFRQFIEQLDGLGQALSSQLAAQAGNAQN